MRGKARGFKLHVSYSEVGTANLTFSSSSVFYLAMNTNGTHKGFFSHL